ncbi:histidine kinase [Aureimonas sp. SA4125]|uniref:Hpt domain-containing protein n=1 Tax=Aureimonas sp. SA4125 TaxID=2826993 RepID=UPI001CC610EA|nr:Hpt domain-containing protein [Aureimonas sp. SA4125]BDA85096.1 histidine kinase [Aureimonas sp. SA4125]
MAGFARLASAALSVGRDVSGDCPSRSRPIDLVHLTRQTLGDRALEREILGLMQRQIIAFADRLHLATDAERGQIAHALKGAARNIGAFALAAAAETLEREPGSASAQAAMEAEMQRISLFIAALGN